MNNVIKFGTREQRRNLKQGQHMLYDELRRKTSDSISGILSRGTREVEVELPGLEFSPPPVDSLTDEGQLYTITGAPGKVIIDPRYVSFLNDHTDIPINKSASFMTAQSLGLSWLDDLYGKVPNYAKSSVTRRNRRLSRPKYPKLWKPEDYNVHYETPQSMNVIKNRLAARIALKSCDIEDVEVFRYSPPYQMHVASILDPMPETDVLLAYDNATVLS